MRKNDQKTLQIRRETLRELIEPGELREVVAGTASMASDVSNCCCCPVQDTAAC